MGLVQRLKGDGKTFGAIAGSVLNMALHEGENSTRIDVVFDVYRNTSIKNAERCHCGSTGSTQWKNIAPGHSVVQWRKLLSNPESKTALIRFIVDQWKLLENQMKLQDKQLFATVGETCYCLRKKDWKIVEELKYSHEEADTCMLLYANHTSQNGYKSTVILSEDTDVMILCLGHCKKISCTMYLKCGTHTPKQNTSTLAALLSIMELTYVMHL